MIERYDENLILAYVENLLSPQDRASFETLLQQDPALKMLIQQLIEDRGHLAALPMEAAPPELMDRVNQQLERQMLLDAPINGPEMTLPKKRRNLGRWMVYSSVAAMLVVTLGAVFILFKETLTLPMQSTHSASQTLAPPLPPPHPSSLSSLPSPPDAAALSSTSSIALSASTAAPDASPATPPVAASIAAAMPTDLAKAPHVLNEDGDRVSRGRFGQEARVAGAAKQETEATSPSAWPNVYIQVMTDNLSTSQQALLAWTEPMGIALVMQPKRSETLSNLRQQIPATDPLWNIQESGQNSHAYQNQNAWPANQANVSGTITYRTISLTIPANQVPRLLNHLNAQAGQSAKVVSSNLSPSPSSSSGTTVAASAPATNASSSLGLSDRQWAAWLLAPLAGDSSTPIWESSTPLLLPVVLIMAEPQANP